MKPIFDVSDTYFCLGSMRFIFISSILFFTAGAGNVSLHHRVQNGSGAHPGSYPMGTRGSFPEVKAAGA
jgi:hypothetical protein